MSSPDTPNNSPALGTFAIGRRAFLSLMLEDEWVVGLSGEVRPEL